MSNRNIIKLNSSNSRKIRITSSRQPYWTSWDEIPWNDVQAQVTKLRSHIYLAKLHGKIELMRRLQRKMIYSRANLIAAIRRVTSSNRGQKTPGIDKQIYLIPARRFRLLSLKNRHDFLEASSGASH